VELKGGGVKKIKKLDMRGRHPRTRGSGRLEKWQLEKKEVPGRNAGGKKEGKSPKINIEKVCFEFCLWSLKSTGRAEGERKVTGGSTQEIPAKTERDGEETG